MRSIDTKYHFMTNDGRYFDYEVRINPQTGESITPDISGPDWTRLAYHQCGCCPLNPDETTYCPLAVQTSKAVDFFSKTPSYHQLSVTITSRRRQMTFNTDAQNGMRSLMGLVMAISGCPKTAFLRPMARFHLPLSDIAETHYRVVSMYMLAQHFIHAEGKEADWEMNHLKDIYADIHTVNSAMIARMKDHITQDAPINALVILDIFALYVTESKSFNLEDLRMIFAPWFKQA